MVSPVEKESGTGAWEIGGAKVSPSGDGIYFHAPSAFAGAEGNEIYNPYIGSRAGGSWNTVGISGRQAAQYNAVTATTYAVSDDLGKAFMASKEALAPGAIPGGSNLYVRDNLTGTYATVAALPGNEAFGEWTATGQSFNPFGGADPSFEHIVVSSLHVLAPGGVEGAPNLYEYSDGQLRLIATEAEPAAPPTAFEAIPNVVSTDGSHIYFNKPIVKFLYLHRAGQETPELVSENAEGNPFQGILMAASPTGEVALFHSPDGVYRFDASAPAGERLTRLTPREGIEGERTRILNAWTGEDLSTFYIAAQTQLTPDAPPVPREQFGNPRGFDLYAAHQEAGQEASLRYLGQSTAPGAEERGPNAFPAVSVSPDSRFFGFQSYAQLTPDAIDGTEEDCAPFFGTGTEVPGRCSNVFAYSYDSNRLTCVSCSGAPPVGESRIGGKEGRNENVTAPLAMLDDGMILFDTPNALLPRDTNGVRDAYAWQGGVTQLISTGTDDARSEMVAASADGSNVFFITGQSLVGQDDDTFADLYDARIDGGLPQDGPPIARPCSSESSCRSGTVAAPVARPGTATVGGSQARPESCPALRDRARKAKKRSRALARRSKAATGRRAQTLRRAAARQARASRRLGRRAGNCTGGGR